MSKKIKKAVFPVAGLGTRFLPATKAIPKEMLPIVDKPLIQYAVEEAKEAGIEEFIFITSRGKVSILNHFDYIPELEDSLIQSGKQGLLDKVRESSIPAGQMLSTRQEKALGLGHAIWCAKRFIGDEPFAVLLPDDIYFNTPNCLQQLVDVYETTGGHIVAIEDVPREETHRYGVLKVIDDNGSTVTASDLVEKPQPENTPSNIAITGRYILDPSVFNELDKKLKGAGGEIQLTEAIAKTLSKISFTGVRIEGEHFDCGNMQGWLEANIYASMHREDTKSLLTEYLLKHGFSVS